MRRLRLSQGRYAFVDDRLYQKLRQYTWYEVKRERTSYAAHCYGTLKKHHVIYMHQMIYDLLGRRRPVSIDHRDGNGLNNQSGNLRNATKRQQQFNRRGWQRSTSGYIGVNFDKRTGRWLARIRINGRCKNLGRYDTETQAAEVRDRYARKHYGRFARLNFPQALAA